MQENRIEGLAPTDLVAVIHRWIEMEHTGKEIDNAKIEIVAEKLFGYPLAARLAAGLVVKYGPEWLIEKPREITELRLDLAKELLSQTGISEKTSQVLQVLSVIDAPTPSSCVAGALSITDEEFRTSVNSCLSAGLLQLQGLALEIHPLVRDYYWRRLSLSPEYDAILKRISTAVQAYLSTLTIGSFEYANILPEIFRVIALTGDISRAQSLRSDLTETLVSTAIQLYNRPKTRPNLELALKYVEIVLSGHPRHWDARLYKAKCLYQLGKVPESIAILDVMRAERPKSPTILHDIGRAKMKEQQWAVALEWFEKALRCRYDHVPSLRDSAECYLRLKDIPNAEGFIKQAKGINAADPYVLRVESLILEATGDVPLAYERMVKAGEQEPENASFQHRLGRMAEQMGNKPEALKHYKTALNLDNNFLEAQFSLASIFIDLGFLPEAEAKITELKKVITEPQQRILRNIESRLLLAREELDAAMKLIKHDNDDFSYSLKAKIAFRVAQKNKSLGYSALCAKSLSEALSYLDEGAKKFGDCKDYQEIKRQIESFRC